MTDNPQRLSSVPFALPGSDHPILSLSGRDAAAFAQAQFMNDVAGLDVGHWQWNGWLTPKGRVIALFALIRLAEDSLWLVLPDADPGGFAVQLQRFVFRSKVVVSHRADLFVACVLSRPSLASKSEFSGDVESGIELDLSGEAGARTLRVSPQQPARGDAEDQIIAWTKLDYAHGFPRLPSAQPGKWTPQQLSLERLRAFSVSKGCYPGQEIVARTHFLGQAKRGLALY
ncbi:MAG: folate-binding protein, partial [Gammaproteobacteria bacterium]|nr:folate-binding protein [Gammaproteobacteria bacterium]